MAVEPDGEFVGVEAVVDKDLASALLAHDLGAEMLLVPTGVSKVAISFGTPQQRWLDTITVDEARAYIKAGEFGAGSRSPRLPPLQSSSPPLLVRLASSARRTKSVR